MEINMIEFAIRIAIAEAMHAETAMRNSGYHNSKDFCQYYNQELYDRDLATERAIRDGKKVAPNSWQRLDEWIIKLGQEFRLTHDQIDEMVTRIIYS